MKITTLVCALGALFLTACSSVGGLKLSSTENVEAKVTRQLFATDQVEIKFNDKVYRGDWNAVSASDEQKSKVSFEHRKHLHSVKTSLAGRSRIKSGMTVCRLCSYYEDRRRIQKPSQDRSRA